MKDFEVEKVAMMLTVSSQVQMCEEELQLSEKLLKEAQKALKGQLDEIQKRPERLSRGFF